MHIQVVNFNLDGLSHDEFTEIADSAAPAFAEVPGLISKVWLSDPENNTYGGVYTWENRDAMDNFASSELFTGAVKNNPNFVNLSVKDYGVLEGPSEITDLR